MPPKCEIVITTEFTQHMYMLTTLFASHTAEMVVVDTIWQLHTLIVMNSCRKSGACNRTLHTIPDIILRHVHVRDPRLLNQ